MDFLKRLFGDDDDKNKPKSKPAPRRVSSIQELNAQKDRAFAEKSLDELVSLLVNSSVTIDWRDSLAAGDKKGAAASEQAWSALKAIQNRTDSQAVLDALIPHINSRPNNVQYQRALASVKEEVSVPTLLEFVKSGETNERLNALKALAEMKAGSAAEALVEFIHDDDQQIRTEAVRALGFTGHPTAYHTLKDYDPQKYPMNLNTLRNAQRWSNVPKELEIFRRRKAKGDLGIDDTLERLEEQYATYWQAETTED